VTDEYVDRAYNQGLTDFERHFGNLQGQQAFRDGDDDELKDNWSSKGTLNSHLDPT